MKQKLLKIVWVILVLLVVILWITAIGKWNQTSINSQKIAKLSLILNEKQIAKFKCLDELTYKQTIEQEKWLTKYCVEYDEEIMKLEEEIENLKDRKVNLEEEVEREPWQLTEDGDHQEMPPIQATEEHERFKELAAAYWLDAGQIWEVENHYWLTEGVALCLMISETSGGKKGYGTADCNNVGNNWNNDRWDRVCYAFYETWLEKIWMTLNNKYLWSKQTLGCLSNAGSCKEPNDNWKRYATSEHNWEANMTACLSTIYGNINPSTFYIRNR